MPIQSSPRQPTSSYSSQYAVLESANPIPQDPCITAPIRPRERAGHDSIASVAPAGHSAPMPIPSTARTTNRNVKLGENPAMKLHAENHRIEIISGSLRPARSASQPEATAPTRRSHSVIVSTDATAVTDTPNSSAIGTMINRKTVKSKASSIQPNAPANQASHWSFVGSFHHGTATWESATATVITATPRAHAFDRRTDVADAHAPKVVSHRHA